MSVCVCVPLCLSACRSACLRACVSACGCAGVWVCGSVGVWVCGCAGVGVGVGAGVGAGGCVGWVGGGGGGAGWGRGCVCGCVRTGHIAAHAILKTGNTEFLCPRWPLLSVSSLGRTCFSVWASQPNARSIWQGSCCPQGRTRS